MISYKPFFETLEKKNISEYELIFKQGLSANTIHRMKKGEAITTKTLDTLCFILDCSVSEIIEHDKTKQFYFSCNSFNFFSKKITASVISLSCTNSSAQQYKSILFL